jgi:hypothetical protein
MALPTGGREFKVQLVTDGRLLGYSHTPAAGDGRLFIRQKAYLRCLDFRKDPVPVAPRPDPIGKGLSGALGRLGSAYQSERDAAVAELGASADAAMAPTLVRILREGRYQSAQAAAATLAAATSITGAAGPALKALVEAEGGKQRATRLALWLHALHGVDSKAGVAATRTLLTGAMQANDQALLARVAEALAEPVFADQLELGKAVLPELKTALSKADRPALEAIGSVFCSSLDLEPRLITPLVPDIIAALRRCPQSLWLQRALLLGLEQCQDEAVFKQAAAYAMETWPEHVPRKGWAGPTAFHVAVTEACPGTVALIALDKFVEPLHRGAAPILKRMGTPAIDRLVSLYPKAQHHDPKFILDLLKHMGPAGKAAAQKLEQEK